VWSAPPRLGGRHAALSGNFDTPTVLAKRLWTFALSRGAVPFRGPWRAGWGTFFLSGAILASVALALAAGLLAAGLPAGSALGLGLVASFLLEIVLDRIYGRVSPAVGPPPAGGDPSGDLEPREPRVPAGSAAASIEPVRVGWMGR
jgi:hypothetical protein